jgi:putative chitobiose transport system substrate-binding protein
MQRIRVWACMTLMALLVPVLVACGGTPAAPGASGSAGDSTGASPAASASGEATASPSAAVTGEPYTIKFWTISLKPTFETYMNDLIAKYEQAHPGAKIEWSDYPGGEIKQKLLTAIASGDVPDVVNLNTDLTLQVASTNPEILTNMSQAVPQATQQEYFEGLWNATQFKGASYGIPWYATVRVVVYNKQIMQEAGIQQPPKTYDDLATRRTLTWSRIS